MISIAKTTNGFIKENRAKTHKPYSLRSPVLAYKTFKYPLYLIMANNYINNSLPNLENFNKMADKEQVDLRYTLYNNKIGRLAPPPKGKDFLINVNFETNDRQKEAILQAFDEYNEIFSVINKNYHFKVNFNPTILDMKNSHSTTISLVDGAPYNGTLYWKWTKNQKDSCHINAKTKGILLNSTILNYNRQVKYVIQHEFGHLLGFHDDYMLDKPRNNSIMNNHIMPLDLNDILILGCLYRHPKNKLSEQEMFDKLHGIHTNIISKWDINALGEFAYDDIELDNLKVNPDINEFQSAASKKNRLLSKNPKIQPLGENDFWVLDNPNKKHQHLYEYSSQSEMFTSNIYRHKKEINHDSAFIHEKNGIYFTLHNKKIHKYFAADSHAFEYTISGFDQPITQLEYIGELVNEKEYYNMEKKLSKQKIQASDVSI